MNAFSDESLFTRLLQGLLSLLGLYALVRFLPRVFKSATKRLIVGIVGEILIVAATLLLTDRAASRPDRSPPANEG